MILLPCTKITSSVSPSLEWLCYKLPQQHLDMGKPAFEKNLKKYSIYVSSLNSKRSATAEQIGKAGIRLYVITYGGRQEDSLNSLRYIKLILWKWYHQVKHLRTPLQKEQHIITVYGFN